MDANAYLWIYSLGEALAVASILAAVFGTKWWQLRRERARLAETSQRIGELFASRAADIEQTPAAWHALREAQSATLKALATPFRNQQIADEAAWEQSLQRVERCLSGLAQLAGQAPGAAVTSERGAREIGAAATDLIAQYRQSRESLVASREATLELDARLLAMHQIHERIRQKLRDHPQQEAIANILLELEQAQQQSSALTQAAATAKRNFKILAQECEDMEDHVQRLEIQLGEDRREMHRLSAERDSLTDAMQWRITELEEQKALVEKMKQEYASLRREYNKLYGVLR